MKRRDFVTSLVATGCVAAMQERGEPTEFDFAGYLDPLRSGRALTKIVINVPSNKDNTFKTGIFKDDTTAFNNYVVDDKPTLQWLGSSFGAVLRLFDGHTIGSYKTKGKIDFHLTQETISIEITQLGFCAAGEYPTDHTVFFNWSIAKFLDLVAVNQSKIGLQDKYLSLLSGELLTARAKQQYAKLFPAK